MANEQKVVQSSANEPVRLLPNQPIILTDDTDFFNTIPKGNTIVNFTKAYTTSLENNKLLALYGDWGSGKTSLIDYISDQLNLPQDDIPSEFVTIYFETWKYEKDDNLALSLVDVILENIKDKSRKTISEFKKAGFCLLKSFAKSISFNIPYVNFDAGKAINSLEKEFNRVKKEKSFHQKMEDFEKSYKKIENEILGKDKKHIIIFIDDLDRCEPENILNLLTALKHFFSLGEKTLFFCGIDKDAVTKAVKHKYQDIVKSEEYLEKVFDISFNMPTILDLKKLITYYFDDEYVNLIQNYLHAINFTNPRHLKKLFNKYLYLKFVKESGIDTEKLIPDFGNGNSLNIIFVIHFIILYEFEKKIFIKLKDFDKRMKQLRDNIKKDYYERNSVMRSLPKPDFHLIIPKANLELSKIRMGSKGNTALYIHFLLTIPEKSFPSPLDNVLDNDSLDSYLNYIDNFRSDNGIQINFVRFLVKNNPIFKTDNKLETTDTYYQIMSLFQMAEKYL